MNQGKKRISTSFLQDFSAIGWLFLIAIAVIAVLCPAGSTNAFSGKLDLSTMVGSFVALDGDTLPKRVTSGQPTRRSRARQMREGKIDTTGMRDKEVARQDTSYKMMRDSSARLAHFLYMRRDKPYVDPLKPRTHSLFLSDPNVITYTEEMDTTTYQFKVRSMFGFKDIKEPITLSFDEYRSVRMSRAIRENWEALAQSYVLESEKKKGLGDLFGKVTNIEIPVPKNPLFSIFGPNRIRLNINGSVDIHGAFRNIKSDLLTTNPFGQSRNEPDFSQEVQIAVKGEIGDKLKIDADWNTQRTFEFENQLHVRYQGYEDEIIQSISAGNVSLPTSSSFISSSQALFGILAELQFGPLRLKTLASQKKGQVKEMSISGGAQTQQFQFRATDYSKDHYYLDESYIPWFDSAYVNIPAHIDPSKEVKDIEVWVTRVGTEDPSERNVVAFIDNYKTLKYQNDISYRRDSLVTQVPGEVVVGSFIRLERDKDYTLNKDVGYITLNRSVQDNQAIAVAYNTPVQTIGNFGSLDTAKSMKLILKLVRPQYLTNSPQFRTAWKLMLKNIYPLGSARGIKKEGFNLTVKYEVSGREAQDNILDNINLLQAFGLDRFDEAGNRTPDNKFDYTPGFTIDEIRGELIFPVNEPFRYGIRNYLLSRGASVAVADSFIFNEVYDTTFNGATNSQRNKYLIIGSASSSVQATYSLQAFGNLVEGSVQVIVDGVNATPNTDYTVDYMMGQVTIRNQAYLVPGKNIQIKYEANDLFQIASKSLLAMRGDVDVGKQSSLGFTIMNLNQQTLSDKVRLGEEPISNTIMNIDGGTSFELPFVTRLVNWLPGIRTNASSSISLRGELAYMLGDPNTRKSPIAQDMGEGIAYIDDFEGSRKTIPFIINYGGWHDISPPVNIADITDSSNSVKMEYKAKLSWYNIFPSDVSVRDIWPQKSVRRGEEQVTVLNLYYKPHIRAPYNYSLRLEDGLYKNPERAWAGIMSSFGAQATNLLDDNINFIELWVRIDSTSPGAKLNIDLGILSEDVIPDRKLQTEDNPNGVIRTGTLKPGEDIGLDAASNDQERILNGDFINKYPQFSGDPAGDDWVAAPLGSLYPEHYNNVNGTEGNSKSEIGRLPDTEDMNHNNTLDQLNSYFEYSIPLDTNANDFKKYISGWGERRWYQLRIPLNEFKGKTGDPSFATVQGLRLWIGGAQKTVLLRIAELNLVGNQWEELRKNDSTFRVSVVNVEDNPAYKPPPGVQRAKDRTRPDENILLNEQALNLIINGLKEGESRQAIKRFNARPMDVFSYRMLKMFIHGDESFSNRMHYSSQNDYDLEVFLRFGTDSLNYYEYRVPVRPGWDPNNDITIRFSDITAIKLGRDSVGALSERVPVPNGPPDAYYQVRGQPTLMQVRFLAIGVENPANKGQIGRPVSGEIWANELRLTDAEDTPGIAYRFDTGFKIADIGTVNFNVTETDPAFHRLEDRFGSRSTSKSWVLSTSFGLERLLPQSWTGSTLGFAYSHSEAIADPRYVPGSDVLVDEAANRVRQVALSKGKSQQEANAEADAMQTQSQSLVISETYSFPQIKLNIPSESWMITETINRLALSYSYNSSVRRDPVTRMFSSWGWNARGSYGLDFSPKNFVIPFEDIGDFFLFSPWKTSKLYFSPRTFNVYAQFNRAQTREQARNQMIAKPVVRSFTASRGMNFGWQLSEDGLFNPNIQYQVDVQSSLVHLETFKTVSGTELQRGFTNILGDIFNPSSLIHFGVDLGYGQSLTISPRFMFPTMIGLDKYMTFTTQYSTRYDWQNNLAAGDLGKSSRWGNSFSVNPDINLKPIADAIWKSPSQQYQIPDTAKGVNPLKALGQLSKILIKVPFFDFERIGVTFSQTNTSQNTGVLGRTGFMNLFGRVPFFQSSLVEYGPSFWYQMGLSGDPHGELKFRTQSKFPFFQGFIVPGPRAKNGNLVDVFSQQNRMTARTSRPLWEGVRLDLNWSLGNSVTINRTVTTDSLGTLFERNRTVSGDIDRSFVTFPNTFIFKMFKTSIEEVNKKFQAKKSNRSDTRSEDQKLGEAFEEGLEGLPIVSKILGRMAPRANWSLRWDGLEKLPLLSSLANRVSLDHGYNSSSRRRWRISPTGQEVTETQQATYAFQPLAGVSITFKQWGGGNLGGQFRYSSQTSYDLAPAAQNITESNTQEISIQGSFNKTGFEIPLFGYALSNDLDISFTYGISKNSRRVYDLKSFKPDGTPLEGSSRTTLEPRLRYTLSAKVTASVYYKYTKLAPDAAGSRIPGSTTNEGGFDVRVQISQ